MFANIFKLYKDTIMKPFEKLKFNITLTIDCSLYDVIIGMNIYSSHGQRIGTSISNINMLKTGKSSIDLTLKNHQLPPGNYKIDLGIYEKGKAIFTRHDALTFEVFAGDCNETFINNRRDKLGVCFKTENIVSI